MFLVSHHRHLQIPAGKFVLIGGPCGSGHTPRLPAVDPGTFRYLTKLCRSTTVQRKDATRLAIRNSAVEPLHAQDRQVSHGSPATPCERCVLTAPFGRIVTFAGSVRKQQTYSKSGAEELGSLCSKRLTGGVRWAHDIGLSSHMTDCKGPHASVGRPG